MAMVMDTNLLNFNSRTVVLTDLLMKKGFAKAAATLAILFAAHSAIGQTGDDDTIKINKLIANYATQLDVGTVSLNWKEQPEVKRMHGFPDNRRTAAILATIWNLAANDELIFSRKKTNDYQVLVSMLTRIHAYTLLLDLTASSSNDLLLREYLAQEIADLKLVFARKNTVAAYSEASKLRDDKQALLLKDPKFVAELVKFRTGKDTLAKSLANVTTMLAFMEGCAANVALCVKLE